MMMKNMIVLILIKSIQSQSTTSTQGPSNSTRTAGQNGTALGESALKRSNFTRPNATQPQSSSAANAPIPPSTKNPPPASNVTEWLPKQLPVWPSVLTQLYAITGNVLGLNRGMDNSTFYPNEKRPKVYAPNAANPVKDILLQTVRILQNLKDFKDPLIYNATLMMSSVPSYLGVEFDRFSSSLKDVISNFVVIHARTVEMDREMADDVKFLTNVGHPQVIAWNATLNSKDFYVKGLPVFMEVSQTYPALMNRTLASLANTRRELTGQVKSLKERITQTYQRVWNETITQANLIDADIRSAETSIESFVTNIKDKNTLLSDLFVLRFNSTCNPSNELLQAAQRHLNSHIVNFPIRVDRITNKTALSLEKTHNEVRSNLMGVGFELRRGYDCVSGLEATHGVKIRALQTSYLSGIAAAPLLTFKSYFTSARTLAQQSTTEALARMTALQDVSNLAASITTTSSLGAFAESAHPLLLELASAFLGRQSVQVTTIPLNSNVFSLDAINFDPSYNPLITSPQIPYPRTVVPELADKVPNSGLQNYNAAVTMIDNTDPFSVLDTNYSALSSSMIVRNSAVFLPMCYPLGFVTNNFAQSLVPYNFGSFVLDIMLPNLNLMSPPEVLVDLFIDDLLTISPIQFPPNPKTLSGTFAARNFLDKMNGSNNFIRAVSVKTTASGVSVAVQVNDINQFYSVLRKVNVRQYIKVSVVGDEQPFA